MPKPNGSDRARTEREKDTVEYSPSDPQLREAAAVPSTPVVVDLGALSHPGKVRPHNEDHYLVARFGRSFQAVLTNIPPEQVHLPHDQAGYCMVLADGMGGAAGGEVASYSAIQDLIQLLLSTPDWIMHGGRSAVERVMERMRDRFEEINRRLNERAQADPRLRGMGTTMTLACSLGLDLVLCHIGDSRAYLFRQGQLSQLTRDMTMAQELVDAGLMSPAQALTNRLRHILTQCLGCPGAPLAQVQNVPLQDDDRLLLCSDGLYDMVADGTIATQVQTAASSQEVCQALVDRALEAGGKDNVTVILAHYRQPLTGSQE
jgi:protein phosphatase